MSEKRTVGLRRSFEDLIASVKLTGDQTRLIAVDGPGGAGKSLFADTLRRSDPGLVGVVHMDDFYLPSVERQAPEGDGEIGGAYDWRRLSRQVLEPLRAGRAASFQRYDWPTDRLAEWHALSAGGVIVVEGVYSNRRELAGFYDLAMWIEVPGEVRLARGVARDGEAMRQRSLREWMPSEDRYRVEHSPDARADLVIDGTSSVSVAGRPGFIVLGEGPDACWEP